MQGDHGAARSSADSATTGQEDCHGNLTTRSIETFCFGLGRGSSRPPVHPGGVQPTHAAMIHTPLYHGCVDAHGVVPSPDNRMLATSGRGSSNVYLIDTVAKKVIGNAPNPLGSASTNPERISSGILVGREPHEPTFTRN